MPDCLFDFWFHQRSLFVLCSGIWYSAMGLSLLDSTLVEESVGDSIIDNGPQGSQVNADGVCDFLRSHVHFVLFKELR